jgi:hypothetical protein
MAKQMTDLDCDDIRELVDENPDEAEIIIEMLKAAGESCPEFEEGLVDVTATQ